jgi:biotin carboxylase
MGYETHVFAWKDGSIGEKTADFFYPISIVEKEEILDKCKEINPCGITSIASDLAVVTVNYVAEKLGLAGNPISITEKCTNKYSMRQALKKAGVKTPAFQVVDTQTEIDLTDFSFPVIVKPTDRSGSRAITKLYNNDNLEQAIQDACEVSFEHKAILEEFIEGDEYSCEAISYQGKHPGCQKNSAIW